MFLPVTSVGVMGDGRSYDWVCRAACGGNHRLHDRTTGHTCRMNSLDTCLNRIINEVDGISRVVYDISGKPPATIEWE